MLSAHNGNKMFHFTSTAFPHYLTKCCAVNINISPLFFLQKKHRELEQATQTNQSYIVTVSEFIWCARNNRLSQEHILDTLYAITQ